MSALPSGPVPTSRVEGWAGGTGDAPSPVWGGVDRLIDSTSDLDALHAHGLHLLAARRWRELGRAIPQELEDEERFAGLVDLGISDLVRRVRAACDGPLVLHKGPEIAARYREHLRSYVDIDLLVPDAAATQQALVAAGFIEVGEEDYFAKSPHSRPLYWPKFPLLIEIHRGPNWPRWLPAPAVEELFEAAVPSVLGVDGVLTLAPPHHALAVAAHAWVHGPLARVRDLVDVRVMAEGLDPGELQAQARAWGIERLWRTTAEVAEALLLGGPAPLPLRTWARNLAAVRERTVLEFHVGRWLGGFSSVPVHRGFVLMLTGIGTDLRPIGGETWGRKLRRTGRALRDALTAKSTHDEAIGRPVRRL